MVHIALGINYRTASIGLRERFSLSAADIPSALQQALRIEGVEEVALLSTCNRTELYASVEPGSQSALKHWFSGLRSEGGEEAGDSLYCHEGELAVRHMMRVASGLDSLVLGEPQILGQFKDAHAMARASGSLGGDLDRLFQAVFASAKKVRSETGIGQNAVSIAYAAVNLAARIFSDLGRTTALLVGAGATIDLVLRHLYRAGARDFVIANRSLERAREAARDYRAAAIGLDEIGEHLPRADIVMTATASPLPILGKGMVERAFRMRKHRPMFMVDLAVPRDIEPEVGKMNDVYLYTVDDLEGVVEENRLGRLEEAEKADDIILLEASRFMEHLNVRASGAVLKQFRERAEKLREQELHKALRQLKGGVDAEVVLRTLAHGLTNKLIHHPTVQVRRASAEGRAEVTHWLRDLYQLSDETPGQTSVDPD